jgi:hypothetical protein
MSRLYLCRVLVEQEDLPGEGKSIFAADGENYSLCLEMGDWTSARGRGWGWQGVSAEGGGGRCGRRISDYSTNYS